MELAASSLVGLMQKTGGGFLGPSQNSEQQSPNGEPDEPIAIKTRGSFTEKKICSIFKQVCLALQALHSQNPPIAHRDIKIENVLIGTDKKFKLCDFGSCTTKHATYESREEIAAEEENIQKTSTAMYRAPEMADLYRRQRISEKVDIWALGCFLYTLTFFFNIRFKTVELCRFFLENMIYLRIINTHVI